MKKKSFFKKRFKILVIFILSVVFYNEILIYILRRFQWNYIPCNSKNCTRFLLVGDPQLIGESFDKSFYNPIAIWDADRNLRSTFKQALYYSKPDVICFLGDLLDEGSISNDKEYERYRLRFQSIFTTLQHRESIYVAGDNDIGGENGDRITQKKIDRFQIAFKGNNIVEVNNIKIYKLNRLTYEIPKDINSVENLDKYRIGLSHFPILIAPGTYSKMVLDRINPHVIFSAHLHESVKIYNTHKLDHTSITKSYLHNNKIDIINLDYSKEVILEIMIPTCSYRMGVKNVGYSVAVIDDHILYYTVLWMPNRFIQLYTYFVCIIISFFILIVPMFFTTNHNKLFKIMRKKKTKKNETLTSI